MSNFFRGAFESSEFAFRFLVNPAARNMNFGLLGGTPLRGLKSGWGLSYSGSLTSFPWLIPMIAVGAATAPRGQKIGSAVGMGASALGTLVGGMLGGPLGAMAATFFLDPVVQAGVAKGINRFAKFGHDMGALEMGGSVSDTPGLYTMRQRAAYEMGRGLLNARQYLGKEALLMHQ